VQLILKLRELNLRTCIADTHFSIFNIIEVANTSPIRDQVIEFSDLKRLTLKDILDYLANLFDVNFEEAPKELMTELARFQGRPKFFFSFLSALFSALNRPKKISNKDEFFACMTQVAQINISTSTNTMRNVLNKYITKNRVLESGDKTTRKLVAQLYVDTVFHRQTTFSVTNPTVNADLVAKGLLMSTSHQGPQHYDINDEPILFAALELLVNSQVGPDFITEYLISPCYLLEYLTDIKGKVTEYLIAWYFIKHVRNRGLLPLYNLLHGVVADDFKLLDHWRNVIVGTRQGCSMEENLAKNLIDLIENQDYQTLQYNMNKNFGPDLCFLVKVKRGNVDCMGAVAIQCKARESFSLNDAARSIQLGMSTLY